MHTGSPIFHEVICGARQFFIIKASADSVPSKHPLEFAMDTDVFLARLWSVPNLLQV